MWSDASAWPEGRVPRAGDAVTIGKDLEVVLDVDAPGLRSLMFSVDDLDATVARLAEHGGTLIGEAVQYEDKYRLCYVRGPAGIIVALAQPLKVARTGPPRPAPGRRSHVH